MELQRRGTQLIGVQLLLLRPREAEVGTLPHLAISDGNCSRLIPMVFLGLLPRLFQDGRPIHRQSG